MLCDCKKIHHDNKYSLPIIFHTTFGHQWSVSETLTKCAMLSQQTLRVCMQAVREY